MDNDETTRKTAAVTAAEAEEGWDGATRVDPARWGKDHWGLLGYIETRCVDHRGAPDHRHMRTDPARHPQWLDAQSAQDLGVVPGQGRCHPTHLAHGARLGGGHDDWDCADDLAAAGLLGVEGTGLQPRWRLTDLGREMAGLLRAHKADGGSFARFAHAHVEGGVTPAERLAARAGGDGESGR